MHNIGSYVLISNSEKYKKLLLSEISGSSAGEIKQLHGLQVLEVSMSYLLGASLQIIDVPLTDNELPRDLDVILKEVALGAFLRRTSFKGFLVLLEKEHPLALNRILSQLYSFCGFSVNNSILVLRRSHNDGIYETCRKSQIKLLVWSNSSQKEKMQLKAALRNISFYRGALFKDLLTGVSKLATGLDRPGLRRSSDSPQYAHLTQQLSVLLPCTVPTSPSKHSFDRACKIQLFSLKNK